MIFKYVNLGKVLPDDDIEYDGGTFDTAIEASEQYKKRRAEQVLRWQKYYSFDYPKHVLDKLK